MDSPSKIRKALCRSEREKRLGVKADDLIDRMLKAAKERVLT